MFFLTILELAGLGVLIPIIDILSSESKDNVIINYVAQFLSLFYITDDTYVIFFLLFSLVVFFLIKSVYSLYVVYKQQYFVNTVFKEMAVRILENSLNLKYDEFRSKDKSLYLKYIVNNSAYLSLCAFNVLQLITELFILVGILIFLGFYVGFEKIVYISLILVIIGLLFKVVTRNISQLGSQRDQIMHEITRSAMEALSGYREIRAQPASKGVVDEFSMKTEPYVEVYAKFGVLVGSPKVVLETITAFIIIFYMFFVYSKGIELSSVIQDLIVFAFAGLRTVPSLTKLLTASANIKYFGTEMDMIKELFLSEVNKYEAKDKVSKFDSCLKLKNICYKYPSSDEPVLSDISLEIEKNKKYGFVGRSGSGKSTLFDIILGFSSPSSGQLFLDGKAFNSFEEVDVTPIMGVVSQNVFALDASFKDNILFFDKAVDYERLDEAVIGSQLLDLIDGDINKPVGENGSNLSGGQKQRLAIARCLYSSKNILLLDEATSALDNQTERQFIDYLSAKKNHTALIIAHRLSTVKNCDRIFVFKNGRVVDEGTYEELLTSSDEFNLLVNGGFDEE